MVDRGRIVGILAGLLLSILVFFRLLLRFLTLGCAVFHRSPLILVFKIIQGISRSVSSSADQDPCENDNCREERSSRSPKTLSDPKWGKHKFINVNGDHIDQNKNKHEDDGNGDDHPLVHL